MKMFSRLWRDETAFVASTDLLLIATILCIGSIVGLVSIRDQVVQELGDVGIAIGQLNQSYTFTGFALTLSAGGVAIGTFSVAGSSFADTADFCDSAVQAAGTPPACIAFVADSEEG